MEQLEKREIQIEKMRLILDKIVLLAYRKHNSSELLDVISFIYENLEKQKDLELPISFKKDNRQTEFNFWAYYDEFDDYCNNRVVVSKDLKEFFVEIGYGNFSFCEEYFVKYDSVRKATELPQKLIGKNDRYYSISAR